ncbi:hypothetical protein [Sphingomonas faeni]|uniref:hypothetical protein n=1 Tax=Sphingomonas faeni TaxID=185950 RepID=UPI002780C3EF|nr:hypothetical protein [Sphingomonas faeni]MDQ0836962.1 hypothetical protein [Sphingomonas faeni]
MSGEIPKRDFLDRLPVFLAAITVTYYVITFAIEVGFFWTVGSPYFASFSVTDHVMHAASYALTTVGVLALIVLVASAPYMFASPAFLHNLQVEVPSTPATWKERAIGFLWQFPGLLIFLWFLYFTALRLSEIGARPTTLFAFFLMLTGTTWWSAQLFNIPRRAYMFLSFMTALILPFALGDNSFQTEFDGPRGSTLVTIGGHRYSARPIIIGNDKAIYRSGNFLYLVTLDGDTMVKILPQDRGWDIIGGRSIPPSQTSRK